MRCISRLITSLVSLWALLPAAETCVLVDGARIFASDLATVAPAFAALPPEKELALAPAGTMVRVFYRAQLAALLPAVAADLPDRLCVQRKRDVIAAEAWQEAVEAALTLICGPTPWKAKVIEAPQHRFPSGKLVFARPGFVASRGLLQIWRGALLLPDKSSIPVWVRVEVRSQRPATILKRSLAAGSEIVSDDYREEEIWAPGLCRKEKVELQLEGVVAKKAIPAGAELLREDLRRAPAVHRGQSVELEAGRGGTRLRVSAIAAHDAEVGERVQLKSSWNGSKLVGRVTGAQKARVE